MITEQDIRPLFASAIDWGKVRETVRIVTGGK